MLKGFYKWFFVVFFMLIFISVGIVLGNKPKPSGAIWDIYETMPRLTIQAFVDSASDGDTILFHAGTYDWSDAPLAERAEPIGAINIIDKTLTIKGEENVLILGAWSDLSDPDNPRGINAFQVIDLNADNDIVFDGLSFQTFLRGISCFYSSSYPASPDIMQPNCRNVTVKNCFFSDIHRDAISLSHTKGDINIQNNDMEVNRFGLYIDWYWSPEHKDWQPGDTLIKIKGNSIQSENYGILIRKSSNVLIERNSIEGSGVHSGILNYGARKGTVISSNTIANFRYGLSVYAYWNNDYEMEAREAVIEKNKLYNIVRWGMFFDGDVSSGHTVSKNEINMAPGSMAAIYSEVHDNYYGQNKITGSGRFAFFLGFYNYPTSTIYAHNETLHANNVNNFTPSEIGCHFLLREGTHDNLIIGSGMGNNTYLDLGYNNKITGVTPMSGGIGQELSEVIKKRNEDLKEAKRIQY